jgi:L-lactate dehydrogenase complex protein LldG
MSEARERILTRLRRVTAVPAPERERTVALPHWSPQERLDRFVAALRAVRAEVHCVAQDWPQRLLELAQVKGLYNLLYAPATEHGGRLAAGSRGVPELIPYAAPIDGWKDGLFTRVDAALTASRGAIAETGSLILWPDREEPRLMSLVPPVHFALLDARRLYTTFAEVLEVEGWSDGMPTNALLVSGPSKTADIEQTLAYGVHGPRELVVLVLEGL